MAGAELAEGEFEEDAGFAEAGGGFEEDERVAFEGRGEIALRRFLAGARGGEGRPEPEVAEAFAGAEAEVEELGDAFELGAEEGVVGGGERDGLREAGLGFDKDELRAERGEGRAGGGAEAEAPQGGVGGELDEIVGVVAAEFGFVGREGAGDGLDFAEGECGAGAEELIDAAGEGEGPAAVDEAALDGDLELGGGGGGGGLGAEFVVPVGAELRAPEAGRAAAAGVVGAEGEGGEFADTQAGGAGVEGEFHAGSATEHREPAEGRLKSAAGAGERRAEADQAGRGGGAERLRRARLAREPRMRQTTRVTTMPAMTVQRSETFSKRSCSRRAAP